MFKKFLLFLFPVTLLAFEIDPWFTPIAEFRLRPSYSYRYYPDVDRAINPSHYSSHDHLIDLNLGVNFLPNWDFQIETDFSSTRKLSWGTQRLGLQLRYLLMDDVAGAPVSLTAGMQVFYVPTRNMRDPSSPYHAQGNLELGIAVGKEIAKVYDWQYRFYGFIGVGTGNRGYPYLRPLLSAAFKFHRHHKFEFNSEGYFGFGTRHEVDIRHLNGYAKIMHQSIDIGASYHYLFEIWGSLGIQYSYRVYARAFPKQASILKVEYMLPFSIF